jgi:ribosomal protein S18 acetylase RimI-like enzyme
MVVVPENNREVLEFLYHDPFVNASLLAAIERRPPRAGTWVYRREQIEGVLLFVPAPLGRRGVGLEATTGGAALALLETLPMAEEFAFGLHRDWMSAALETRFRARQDRCMGAFRCDAATFRPVPGGRALAPEDDRVVRRCGDDSFLESFRRAVRGIRTPDGLLITAYAAFDKGRIAARCLATWGEQGIDRQIGTVWSVFTEPGCRGRGLGRAAVSAATAAILASGRTARYFAYAENEASQRLCAALGYGHDHDIQYFHGTRRPAAGSREPTIPLKDRIFADRRE